jgi:hypothetical protein
MKIKIPPKFQNKLASDTDYQVLVNTVIKNVENYFHTDPPEFFSEYTLHGKEHIKTLLKLSAKLIDNSTLSKMRGVDVAVLILSIVLHDIGMFVTIAGLHKFLFSDKKKDDFYKKWITHFNEIKNYGDDKWLKIFGFDDRITEIPNDHNKWTAEHIKIIGDFLRRNHHFMSHEFIVTRFPVAYEEEDRDIFKNTIYALDDPEHKSNYKVIRDIIGIIAESHCMPIRDTEINFKKGNSVTPFPRGIPVFFIMAILRLADYLHAGEGRAPNILKTVKGIKSQVSKNEYSWNQRVDFGHLKFDNRCRSGNRLGIYKN